jgi:PAS domain S-box-containing protein
VSSGIPLRSWRFAVALLSVLSATVLRYVFNPLLGFRSPLLFHVLAVAVVAQISGIVSGLIATGLSVVLIDYFFVPPLHSLSMRDPADNVALLLFGLVGVVLSVFGGRRKRAEEELLRIRYNLETAQHIANIGSWESDLIRRKLWWSTETYNIFGVPAETKLNTDDFYESVHSEDRVRVRETLARAVESRSDYDIEHRIVRRSDGKIRTIHQQAKLIQQSGATVRLIGSIKDITDTKRGEMAEQILGGILQVCSACRRIRDANSDEWYSMEGYLRRHSTAEFSHGMCPDCGRQWYPGEGRP